MDQQQKILGGLYGLLIGDALGVPYEFHQAQDIPPYIEIEMTPPTGFRRAHAGTPPGTWSDDGAQALCLLDSLVTCGAFDLKDFSDRLLAWYQEGLWAVEGRVFDVGIQTSHTLSAYRDGVAPEESGLTRPNGKGNGALMRVLPLALWHVGSDRDLVRDAHRQCLITHGHVCNQVCCALYCLVARRLLQGHSFAEALKTSAVFLKEAYAHLPDHLEELEALLRQGDPWQGHGSGYVVDSLASAFMLLEKAESYEEAVKMAIQLGDDTDTTACVTGGLAGILFGLDGIPQRWYDGLRGKEDVAGLLDRWSRCIR